MAPLNITRLEELFEEGGDKPETIAYWYERLSQYEPEGDESPRSVEIIVKAMKWIMQYEHAKAEELKELAEKEAAEIAEKQENWEEEKEQMKNELNSLRGRITSTANASDLNEAFRAQINSLQEENAYLKAQNRERDRELSDQSERVERLSSRIEQLEKERATLTEQQAFSEDAIRELNRRLDSKTEASANNEAEAAKLRQRSQQAAQLSKQLQEVAQQNDELRAEVEQLSSSLTSATTFIEDTAENYMALREQLLESDKIIERLTNDNELLTKKLGDERAAAGKLENIGESSVQQYKNLLHDKDEQIETLQQKFENLQVELQELQTQFVLENKAERKEEMERLRVELVEATKIARQLFGATVRNDDDSVAQMQHKITELMEAVDAQQRQVRQLEIQNAELIRNLELKDAENLKMIAEIKRLRVTLFGSAEVEISRLEKQLNFREQQIEKLTTKCSLLQAELSDTGIGLRKPAFSVPTIDPVPKVTTSAATKIKREEMESERYKTAAKISLKQEQKSVDEDGQPDVASEGDTEVRRIQKRTKQLGKKKEVDEGSLESWEASAMIISSLNHELMLLMQEIDEKNRQLRHMEKTAQHALSCIDEIKLRYLNLQEEISQSNSTQHNKLTEELREKVERYEIEIEEYQKLGDSMRMSENDAKRRMEEMNRQIVAERLRNLQLVRKLQTVERIRNDQSADYSKLERNYQEQKLLHAKQRKIASYESDLAAIEIARLQTVLLHSVRRIDYDELMEQYKHLLASDGSFKIQHFKTDQMDEEYIGINLLKEMADETRSAELLAENEHLKEMINVLTSQNEYWQAETAKIRAQNSELMQFLDDFESESRVKSLLAALERRFLKALSENAQRSQNQTFTTHQFLDLQNEFTRKQRSWANEKKKLVQVIRSLQLLLQRIRSNSMELITVQQMLAFKEKVAQVNANYAKSQKYKEEIEKEKEELDLQLRNAEALRKSFEQLKENDYSIIKLQKSLQANQLNMLSTTKELKNAELQIQKKDAQIQKLQETVSNAQREIDDLFVATFKISDFDDETKTDHEQFGFGAEVPNAKMQEPLTQTVKSIPKLTVRDIETEDGENVKTGETPTETFDSGSEVKLPALTEPQIAVTTNIADVIDEHEKKLNYIRETAELCIENYKERLKYKDEVIEKYKVLLRSMQEEAEAKRTNGSLTAEDSEKRKLRKSNEILSQNYGDDKEAKVFEIIKLRNEIKHFTKANERLTDELDELRKEAKELAEVSTQTDILRKDSGEMEKEILTDEKTTPATSDSDTAKKREEPGKAVAIPEPRAIQTPPLRPTRTIPIELTDAQDDVLTEALRREESTTMAMRMEIRKLKQRIAALNARNQELEKACETIRAEALSEIERSYAPPSNNAEWEITITKLQQELYALKKESINQKTVIREQKETIDQLQGVQETGTARKAQVDIAKWHEKKALEGSIDTLRKKLKEMEQREKEVREKLEKRDRRIEQLNRSESTRSMKLERLQGIIRKLSNDKEACALQEKVAKDRLKTSEETKMFLHQRISQLEKENEDLLTKIGKKRLESRTVQKSTIKVSTKSAAQNVTEGELLDLREKAKQFDDLTRRIAKLKNEVDGYRDEIRMLNDKLNERKYDCGAVAVLRDKLMAKERVIEQQQKRIEQLEREKWQNLL